MNVSMLTSNRTAELLQRTTGGVAASGGAGFEALLQSAQAKQDEKGLREATTQMEAAFVNLMWKAMRATVPKSTLLPMGLAGDVYEDLMYQAYSERVAAAGTGLGEMLRHQLAERGDNAGSR